jgi:hypothetical protein
LGENTKLGIVILKWVFLVCSNIEPSQKGFVVFIDAKRLVRLSGRRAFCYQNVEHVQEDPRGFLLFLLRITTKSGEHLKTIAMKITSYITVYVALQNDQLNGSVKQLFLGGFFFKNLIILKPQR